MESVVSYHTYRGDTISIRVIREEGIFDVPAIVFGGVEIRASKADWRDSLLQQLENAVRQLRTIARND